ncbi:MAG: hypothetical protein ACRCZP_19965 [Phycicoccus sp.]
MAYGSGREHTVLYQNESTFGTVPAAWSSGITFLAVDPQLGTMTRGVIPNDNYRQRIFATRPMVLSLANGELSFGVYMHGRSTAVADDARATITSPNFPIGHFLQNAWGGIRLGYRTVVASGTAAAPVVEAGDGTQYEAGDWVFAHDTGTDATRGYFRKIASISTDTLTMWAGHDLPFTPATSDVFGAVIQAYPHRQRMVNQAHASHLTQSFLHFGELSEDVQQGAGVKLNLTSIEGLGAGEAGIMKFTGLVAQVTKEGLAAPTAADPLGDAPLATATGDDTLVYISAVGATLATVEAQSVTVTPGFASQPVPCVGGVEGRSGYTIDGGSIDAAMIEITVDFDLDWSTGFLAGTRYQILIQVGTVAGRAYGIFAANCELVEDPGRGEATDLAVSVLKFRCLESAVSTAATGDALEKVRAKLELLFSCALS